MLVLTSADKVQGLIQLLEKLGYPEDGQGVDGVLSSMDIRDFLNCSILDDKVVIAPHVDSEKGIYNDLKGGYRAEIFKNENICAITCNSAKTLEKIQGILKSDPNYRRSIPWAYINASDAHKPEEIGSKVSYIKLEHKKFDLFKEAFSNPIERISDIENPELEELINTLCKSQKSLLLLDFNKDVDEFAKVMCAFLNSDCHSMLLGIKDDMEIKGVDIVPDEIEKLIQDSRELLNDDFSIRLIMLPQSLGNGRYVYIILRHKFAEKIYYITDINEAYVYSDKVHKAKICDIEEMVSERILSKLTDFQKHNEEIILQTQKN